MVALLPIQNPDTDKTRAEGHDKLHVDGSKRSFHAAGRDCSLEL